MRPPREGDQPFFLLVNHAGLLYPGREVDYIQGRRLVKVFLARLLSQIKKQWPGIAVTYVYVHTTS